MDEVSYKPMSLQTGVVIKEEYNAVFNRVGLIGAKNILRYRRVVV